MEEREPKSESLETFKESFREGVAGLIGFCEEGLETLEGESFPFVPLDPHRPASHGNWRKDI